MGDTRHKRVSIFCLHSWIVVAEVQIGKSEAKNEGQDHLTLTTGSGELR